MATTNYGVNHPLARKHWGDGLMKEALRQTWFLKFVGKDKNSLVYVKEETNKGKGDKITYGLRRQLSGDGVSGDNTLEGNEEALVTHADSVVIDQIRHAVRSAGKMSEQRVPFEVREEARDGLADWLADRWDRWFFNQLGGNTAEADLRYTGFNATVAPTADHHIIFSADEDTHSAESSLSTTDTFRLELLDWAAEKAKTIDYPIRPIKIMGDEWLVAFLHPYQVTDLRTNTNTGQWLDIQKAAMQGGDVTNNPIFTGALGVYNNIIMHEAWRLPQAVQSGSPKANTRRAVVAGAQALCMAFGVGHSPGKAMWNEELFDFGNQLGVAAGCISGMKKSVFNSIDYGTIVISTYAAAHG